MIFIFILLIMRYFNPSLKIWYVVSKQIAPGNLIFESREGGMLEWKLFFIKSTEKVPKVLLLLLNIS